MEHQEERCCKICGKKLNKNSVKTQYCSFNCVLKDKELIEDGKNPQMSLGALSRKYKAHRDKVAAALFEAGIRNSYIRRKTCPKCGKVFYMFGLQKHCSIECAEIKKTKEHKRLVKRNENARRRAFKNKAETDTANKKLIQLIYKHAPEGYHVDHIIPITKGGLHHEDNLQYLPASENSRKKDRLDYEPQGAIRWQDVIQLTEE
jgi:hypothetical protein